MIILYIVLAVIAIPFVVALFLKKEYTVQRSITIDRPKEEVFRYVKHVRNTEHFSKWVMDDPNSKREYIGTDGTVGFVYKWNSEINSVGEGAQEITAIEEGRKVQFEIRFIRPFAGKAISYMETSALEGNKTHLRWVFNGIMKYPMNFMMLFMNFDKILGKDQETSLNNLQAILERK